MGGGARRARVGVAVGGVLFVLASLCTIATSVASAAAPARVDPFRCYAASPVATARVRTPFDTAPRSVRVRNAYTHAVLAALGAVQMQCDPARMTVVVNGHSVTTTVTNAKAHELCWSITAKDAAFPPTLTLDNQFGTGVVRPVAATTLCVASWNVAAGAAHFPAAKTPPNLGAFACYAVVHPAGTPAFHPPATVHLTDQLGTVARRVGAAVRVCVPSSTSYDSTGHATTIVDPTQYTVCYADDPTPAVAAAVSYDENVFGVGGVRVARDENLCVRSTKHVTPPPPTTSTTTTTIPPGTFAPVTDFADPTIKSPVDIAVGPDGALWFTNHRNHAIGRLTTRGQMSVYTDPGIENPYTITDGPDGALWFTNNGHHSIGRISPNGIVSHYTNVEISNPLGITAGPDGALWFDNLGNNSIARITTDTLPATRPDQPTITSVADAGQTGIGVYFRPGFDGGATATYTASCISLLQLPTVTATGTTSPVTVTGVSSNDPYQCTVTATNIGGTSAVSVPSAVIWPGTNGVHCAVPSAPSMLSTTPGNGSAVVSWAPAASGCVAGYIVTPYLKGVPQLATLIPGNGTTTVISPLTPGLTYRFTVTAENGAVAGPPSPMSAPVTIGG